MGRILVASHRGPVSYRTTRGRVVAQRGQGGLINVVRPVVRRNEGTWVASALTPEDRAIATDPRGRADDDIRVRFLDLPQDAHAGHYDLVCNENLWYVFHYLYDTSDTPRFDAAFWRAWNGYRAVNRIYAEAILRQPGHDAVLVQDYHLMLVASELRKRRFDVPLSYFHHAPWSEPDYLGILPIEIVRDILSGLLAHDVVAFHAGRWATAFLACCERYCAGASLGPGEVTWRGHTTKVVVAPAARDAAEVQAEGADALTERCVDELERQRDGRRVLVRVERIDLSKNVLRGFLAFEALLDRRPELAKEVWFLAFGYASRTRVARYRRYAAACNEAAERLNARFASGRADEGPLRLDVQDEFHRSLAGMRVADALLVNPVFDGLNLVAKEAAMLNERDGALVLSRNAGVFEELGDAAIGVNPFDVSETAAAIERALEMPEAERARRAARLRRAARVGTPEEWLRRQLDAAGVSL